MALSGQPSNFAHLRVHDEQLVRLGQLAERYFVEDPNTCLLKLRQLTELLAQLVASNVGLFTTPEEKQAACADAEVAEAVRFEGCSGFASPSARVTITSE